jgi:hypothetical protein
VGRAYLGFDVPFGTNSTATFLGGPRRCAWWISVNPGVGRDRSGLITDGFGLADLGLPDLGLPDRFLRGRFSSRGLRQRFAFLGGDPATGDFSEAKLIRKF